MPKLPKVSIIIPSFNNEKYIGYAISSVLNQTYQNIEIIVVDDNSQDDTEKVVKSFENKDLTYIKLNKNMGASAAKNIGIQKSTGEYIAFLDSDDMYDKDKIDAQIDIIELDNSQGSDVGVVYCGIKIIDENAKVISEILAEGREWDGINNGDFIGATALVKRECFDNIGLFDPNLKYFEDMDLYFRIHKNGYNFNFAQKPLYLYRIHANNVSKNREILLENIDNYYKKYLKLPEYRYNLNIWSQYFIKKGITLFKVNPIISILYVMASIILNPIAGYSKFKTIFRDIWNKI